MFSPGMRVVLLASSHTKDIGPKRGSLGYVAYCSETHLNSYNNGSTHQLYLVTRVNVMFSRYGFEKKARCENREIINVLPIFYDKIPDLKGSIHNAIKHLIKSKELSLNPFFRSSVYKTFSMGGGTGEHTTGILAPAGLYAVRDLRTYSEHEVRAWVEALVRNIGFIRAAQSASRKTVFESLHHNDIMRWIIDCRKDKKYKDSLFNWVRDNPKNMEEITEILARLNAVFTRRRNEMAVRFFTKHVVTGKYGKGSHNRFIKDFPRNMYEPDILAWKGGLVKEKVSHHKEAADSILAARDITLSLVPKNR